MKRYFSVILLLLFLASLVGCAAVSHIQRSAGPITHGPQRRR